MSPSDGFITNLYTVRELFVPTLFSSCQATEMIQGTPADQA